MSGDYLQCMVVRETQVRGATVQALGTSDAFRKAVFAELPGNYLEVVDLVAAKLGIDNTAPVSYALSYMLLFERLICTQDRIFDEKGWFNKDLLLTTVQ